MNSPLHWIQANLDLVSFLYGAAFVLLGTVILSQPARGSAFKLPGILWLLAAFGLTQGIAEWLVTWMIVKGDSQAQEAIRMVAQMASFLLLFEFSRRLLLLCAGAEEVRRAIWHPFGLWLYLPVLVPNLAALFLAPDPTQWISHWTRYQAGFGGATLAAIGLWWYHSRRRDRLTEIHAIRYFPVVSIAMAAYGVFAGLIGPAAEFFPASWLNEGRFLSFSGLPVDAIRAGLAIVLAVGVGRMMVMFHREARQKLQDALDEVSRRHELILEAAGEGIFLLDRDGNIAFANPAALRMLGYRQDALVGQSYHAMVQHSRADGSPYHTGHNPIVRARIAGQVHSGNDEVFWRKDGTSFVVEHTCTPIREGAELIGAVLTFNDITERKKIDILLRDTQAMAKVGGWDVDLRQNKLSWTDEVYRIHELQVGSPITVDQAVNYYHPDSRPLIREAIQQGMKSGESFDLELRLITAHDRLIWVRVAGRAYLRDGRTYRLAGTFQDITDRRRGERALRENKNFYELILDSVPMRIACIRADRRIAYVNRSYEEWFQKPRTQILGKKVREIVTAEAYANIKPYIRKVLAGTATSFQVTVEREDATYELDISYLPHRSKAGEVIGFFSVVQDMTEHKQLEAKLRQAQKMEAVGQLTGGVAHDFNNLLSVILGNLQLLERPLREDERLLKKIKTAARAARRGADLTKRLLAFSRGQVLEPRVLDLNVRIAGLDELLGRTLGESIDISTSFADNLWPTVVDPGQLENSLLNLAINARDAMPEGGKLTIETANVVLGPDYHARHPDVVPGDYVMVAVTDTGVGMSTEVLQQVFEPFFTTKESGKGSGLGLSMVYGFVEQSGGHANIYSEEGHGTSVKFYLPRAQPEAKVSIEETGVMRAMPVGRETILVVEDDADVRETVVTVLSNLGYEVLEAADGNEALQQVCEHGEIDLLFTDVTMPGGMHGPVLAAQAQERRPGLKVLFTTGYAESAIMHRGVLVDSTELIGKPYANDELARKVRLILDKEYEDEPQSESSVGYR